MCAWMYLTAVKLACVRLINNVWGGRGREEGVATDGESVVCVWERERERERVRVYGVTTARGQRGTEKDRERGEEHDRLKERVRQSLSVSYILTVVSSPAVELLWWIWLTVAQSFCLLFSLWFVGCCRIDGDTTESLSTAVHLETRAALTEVLTQFVCTFTVRVCVCVLCVNVCFSREE